MIGRDSALEELQLRNKFLSEKLENLERALAGRQSSTSMPVCTILLVFQQNNQNTLRKYTTLMWIFQ